MLDENVGSRQTLGTNDLAIENIEQPVLMPTHDQYHENTKFSENTSKNNKEFHVYSRRNRIERIEKPTLKQGHEFVLRTDLISPLEKSKPLSKPCSSFNINHEDSLSDLDVPMYFEKVLGLVLNILHPISCLIRICHLPWSHLPLNFLV